MDELLTVADFREAARRVLEPQAWDYFDAASDGQALKQRNRTAWDEIELRPRVLVDVSTVDTSTWLLGMKLPFPAMVAPMAYQCLAHPEGELATARACATTGVPLIVSTMATHTLEDVANVVPHQWFQLYCHRDPNITDDLIRRAEAAGYRAIVVTADAPILGRRIADERNKFELPAGLTRANLVPYESLATDRAFERRDPSHLAEVFRMRQAANITWQDIDRFRSLTDLPVLLKGISRADDAKRAVETGCAGIVVSNHGGRQLDASIATARALPAVVAAVNRAVPVLVDGGVEWGADILRALALGADAVLVGRPILWGLAVGGTSGVTRMLDLYMDDFRRAMQLCGCARVADVNRDLL